MFPSKASEPGVEFHHVRLLGVNGADPTKQLGQNITATRTGEGAYTLTWSKNPGTFLGIAGYCFGAATPSDVKGYTLTRDTFTSASSTTSASLDIAVWDSSFAAADIIANQYLDVCVAFKTANV